MAHYNHGLHGRERYLHYRERENRLFQRHLLDDYFGPERSRKPARRFVPIRRRAEFVAETIAVATAADVADRPTATSGELPTPMLRKGAALRESAIRFDRSTANHRATQRLVNVLPAFPATGRRKPGFTARGFLTGCAMGGMAAAVVLLLLQTIVG